MYNKIAENVFNRHQLKILLDTVKNPNKSLLGGPSAEEAEEILKKKFKYTDAQIKKLKDGISKTSAKKTPKEKAKELGLSGAVAEKVIAAYSDVSEDVDASRNLDYFETTPVTGQQLIEIMSKVVPSYNDFDGSKSIKQVVNAFGSDADYHIARESSVCIYVDLKKENHWLKEVLKIKADELSYDGKRKMFRVWWD
jgi:hypothetical protein